MVLQHPISVLLLLATCGTPSRPCAHTSDCKPSEVCVVPNSGTYYCAATCGDGGACPSSTACNNVGTTECQACAVVISACTPK